MSEPRTAEPAPPGLGMRALKWVGAMTAILSLVVGIQQFVSRTRESVQRGRDAAELVETARGQASRQAFSDAWKSLDRAAALDPGAAVDSARLEIGFAWLEDAHPGPGNPFSSITDVVTPALDRALVTAMGTQRADILAHLGWATFLRSRDGALGDPEARYKEALAVDPRNAYANAMLGHWMMWHGATVDAAREHFTTALASTGAPHVLARNFQLAALRNRQGGADDEMLRVATEMRKGGEPLDGSAADGFYGVYSYRWRPSTAIPQTQAVPGVSASDIEATYEWVVKASSAAERSPEVTTYVRAVLQDAAGDRNTALATLRTLQRPDVPPLIREAAQSASTRFSTAKR